MGCVQSYFRKAHSAGLSPSSTHGSEKAGIPQDTTADVADLVEHPEKEPLEVTDVLDEVEFTLTEKPNESASELNGTVKAGDGDSGKLIPAATGTLAVISVAATVAAVTTNNEENKESAEETKVTDSDSANVPALQASANSKADTAEATEDRDAKSPKSVKSEDEAVIVEAASRESGTAGEREQSGSASTPTTEDATTFSEGPPSDPVPDNELSTAKLEEIPEQGRRPTSASQTVANEEYGGSRPTSAVVEGTTPTSASPAKEESVPEQQQHEDTSMSPSGTESTRSRPQSGTEQGTKSRKGSRPVSATESNNEANRQTSFVEFSKDNTEISENLTVETNEVAKVGNPQATTAEGADRPASGVQDSEQPRSATGSVQEDGNRVAESNEEEESRSADSAVDNIEVSEEANEIRPISIAVSIKEESSRPVSVVELTSQERSRPASSAVDTMEVSEEPAGSRPTSAVKSATEEENVASENEQVIVEPAGSPPLNADELEGGESGPKISGLDTVHTTSSRPVSVIESTEENGTRSVSAAQPAKEEESVEGKNADVTDEPTGSAPLNADELEADGSMPESSEMNTVENSEEIEISLPISVSESTKEDISQPTSITEPAKEEEIRPVHSAIDNSELSEEPAGNGTVSAISESTKEDISQPTSITEPATEEEIRPVHSAIDSSELSEEPAGKGTVGAISESNKEDRSQTISMIEPTKEEESRPVHSAIDNAELSEEPAGTGMVSAVSRRPTSTIAIAKEEDGSVNVADSAKYEGSRPTSVAENDVSKTPSEIQPVFDSAQGEGSHQVCVTGPTEEAAGRPVSASESVKEDGIESTGSTQGNGDITEERSESQPLTVSCPTKGEGNRPVDADPVERGESRTSAKEDSRPDSATETSKAGIRSTGDVESTKEDENRSAAQASEEEEEEEEESSLRSAAGPTEEEGGLINTAELAKEEGSRLIDVAATVEDEGTGQAGDAESIKGEVTKPVCTEVSTNDEGIELAKEEGSRQMGAADYVNEEEIRQGNTAESINEVSRPVSLSSSTKDEGSRTPSVAADDTGPTQTSQSRSVSVSGSVTEENIPAISATENVENSTEPTGNKLLSATESTKEGSQTVSSVAVKKSSTEEQAVPGVENESEEDAAESKEDVQIAQSRPVSSAIDQEIGKSVSRPSSAAPSADTQERTEDGRSTAEIGNDSRPPSALLSVGAESEITKEDSEQGLLSSGVGGTTERVESPTSAHSDDIPSLTVTEAVEDPGSDSEAGPSVAENKPVEDEKKPAAEGADEDLTVVNEMEAQNTAATMIQASFRGYQTRQALSKAAEKHEVPQSVTSHDFLFGPAVQPSLAVEGSPVDGTSRGPETEEKEQESDNELVELQKPQECDELRAAQEDASVDLSDADSSVSTAATKIQAGVRGFLARRHVHNMKASNSTTAPSIGDSQQSLGDMITSQEMEDEGVHTSGSMETEVQKQHQFTTDDEISQSQENTSTTKNVEVQNGLSLDSHLKEKAQRTVVTRSAISLQLDGPVNEDEDRKVWQTLKQEDLDDAATKIQSSYRGYRMRRSLKREDAVQMPTTSTSTTTASSDVISDPMRHSGEFHDMVVLPPSPEEDIDNASAQNHVATASSTPLQSGDDVTSAAGNQETDMTESKQGGRAKMDEKARASESEAATRIQASYRGFKTRQDIKTANMAASKIQAGFRGYKVRKQLRENTEEENKNGPRSQGSRPQSANQEEEEEVMKATNETPAGDIEERSATKIQAGVRGYLVRKRRQAERDAAVKIQAGFRGYQARREVKGRQQQQQHKK